MDHVNGLVPPDSECVLGAALQAWTRASPDRCFVRLAGGESWTFAQTLATAQRCAGGLRRLGVGFGDRVLVWLPNGPDILRVWFGANLLGAVFVPVNTAYRGRLLEHVIGNAEAAVLVLHADLVPRLSEIDTGPLRKLVILGGDAAPPAGIERCGADALDGAPLPIEELPAVRPWDLQAIVYTSGTTGPSKGVLTSYLHLASMAAAGRDMVTKDDRRLVNLPLFHSGGMLGVYGMLLKGGSVALVDRFDTATFWQTVRETEATVVTLLGAMIAFLMKAPPSARDRDHTLRTVSLVPMPEGARAFAERFGVDVYTNYNSTETSNPLVSGRDPEKAGVCGRPRPGVEARIVDDNDFEVPTGAVGELVLRTARPWAMTHGYNKDPEATARAWRNGWLHTGDLFRRDADGDYYFVDRKKDAIRRRGENISTFEVESEILMHPDVREAAVVAVPSEFGEDEVLAVIAAKPGARIDPAELLAFLRPRMAHFMIPRYVRIVPELPKTPTQKVEKYRLRAEGLTPDVWDREAAGIVIKRDPIGR